MALFHPRVARSPSLTLRSALQPSSVPPNLLPTTSAPSYMPPAVPPTSTADAIFSAVDVNRDGTIDRQEFAAFQVGAHLLPPQKWEHTPHTTNGSTRLLTATRVWHRLAWPQLEPLPLPHCQPLQRRPCPGEPPLERSHPRSHHGRPPPILEQASDTDLTLRDSDLCLACVRLPSHISVSTSHRCVSVASAGPSGDTGGSPAGDSEVKREEGGSRSCQSRHRCVGGACSHSPQHVRAVTRGRTVLWVYHNACRGILYMWLLAAKLSFDAKRADVLPPGVYSHFSRAPTYTGVVEAEEAGC